MIERASEKPCAGGLGRFGEPGAEKRLGAVLAAADAACVVPEARSGVALKSLASGVPVEELARITGVIDVEGAEIRDLLAQAQRDKSQAARSRARTADVVTDLVATGEFPNLAAAFGLGR